MGASQSKERFHKKRSPSSIPAKYRFSRCRKRVRRARHGAQPDRIESNRIWYVLVHGYFWKEQGITLESLPCEKKEKLAHWFEWHSIVMHCLIHITSYNIVNPRYPAKENNSWIVHFASVQTIEVSKYLSNGVWPSKNSKLPTGTWLWIGGWYF